ncbi:LPS biosynthesis choline kinase [Vibrio sinaloensis DSM 21326]|uniref:LPS biosynthesis choline kinase n=1 Tax=Vibrio sinaloensis DSM 21326 TaxID=945550 RepID=E8MDF2_PHOS4|nr:hypothetical protein [Vibrio sinaloensis]EGA67938.1 LPS biosynthesis choline kinase [Vibrio sinaloensis DSM 21326]
MSNKNLAQMGSAKVHLGEFAGQQCIVKHEASDVEIAFYTHANVLLDGVNTPQLLHQENRTLFLEYIPTSIDLAELVNQEETFRQLASIHSADADQGFLFKRHLWTSKDTLRALDHLSLPTGANRHLLDFSAQSHELFSHHGLISGDSNSGNWGKRLNGELVLFDWERFGCASPAIDLAPLVKGLGTEEDYRQIIAQYRMFNSRLSEAQLIRHLVLAKAWIIVEVTNLLTQRRKPEAAKFIDWYRSNAPSWLASVEHLL